MFFTWLWTVIGLMPRAIAMSAVDPPSASMRRISRSRPVNEDSRSESESSRTGRRRSTSFERWTAGRTNSPASARRSAESVAGPPGIRCDHTHRAGGERTGRRVRRSLLGDTKDPRRTVAFADQSDRLEPVPGVAIEIDEDEVHRFAIHRVQSGESIGYGTQHGDRHPSRELELQRLGESRALVDDQDPDVFFHGLVPHRHAWTRG